MKKIRNILIMMTILVLLLIVYLVASPMWREDSEATTEPTPSYTVAVIDHNALVGLKLEHGETSLSFSLNEGGTEWNWSEDSELSLDNTAFASVVTALNEASSGYILEGLAEEQLAEYGLDAPILRASFGFSDGSTKEFIFGDLNSFNSLYYFAEVSEPNTVYMVSSEILKSLELDIYDFILEETPPTITEGKLLYVSYDDTSERTRLFSFYPSGKANDYTDRYEWYISNPMTNQSSYPLEYPLAGGYAETLTELATSLYFEECVGLDASDGSYGFSPNRRLTIHYDVDEEGNGILTRKAYVLYLGAQREDGGIYVHTEDSSLVYILGSSDEWIDLLTAESHKLMPSEIWLPNYERIDSLTFTAGEGALTVKVNNTDGGITYSSSATEDAEALAALTAKLDALKATSNTAYLESKLTDAERSLLLSIRLALNAGDSTELEMNITRYSTNYCLVSFNGRQDQLVTAEAVEELIATVDSILGQGEKAE